MRVSVKFFTFVGLSKSVQSDQGSNFMFGVFQQVMHELGIKQYRSSAYHPESEGALVRFHQTLKNMIRSYCVLTQKKIGMKVCTFYFLRLGNLYRSLSVSVSVF